MRSRFVLLILGLVPACVPAQSAPVKTDLIYTHDALSGGFKSWDSVQLTLAQTHGRGRASYGSVGQTRRFGETDTQFIAGAYNPVAPRLGSLVELSFSPTHQILARFAGTAQLLWEVGKGYVVTLGFNRTEFRSDLATGFVVGAEKYWGKYRAAYFFSGSDARHAGFAAGHRFSLNEYLNDTSSVGLTLSFGREVESVGVARILRTDVFGISASGRVGISAKDSLYGELGYFRQGDLYVRRSIGLGFRHAF